MATYLIGWPDRSWSVYVTATSVTLEQIWDAIDASDDPGIASVFRVKKDGGVDCYVEIPQGSAAAIPMQHWGDLEPLQLKPPYEELWREYQSFPRRCTEEDSDG